MMNCVEARKRKEEKKERERLLSRVVREKMRELFQLFSVVCVACDTVLRRVAAQHVACQFSHNTPVIKNVLQFFKKLNQIIFSHRVCINFFLLSSVSRVHALKAKKKCRRIINHVTEMKESTQIS
jgi:hypothetical protein